MYCIIFHARPYLLFTSFCPSSLPVFYPFDCLSPSIPVSPARVFIFARPTAECLTRWKELGVKRQHCCQLGSLSPSLSLSLSDSRYISANVLLTSSTPMKYQQKLLHTLLTTTVIRTPVRAPFLSF